MGFKLSKNCGITYETGHNGYNQVLNNVSRIMLPLKYTIPAKHYFHEISSDPLNENYTYNWESNDTADEQYSSDPDAETFLLPTWGSYLLPSALT